MQASFPSPDIYDRLLPWIALAILLALVILVGPKAGASEVKLKDNAGYKKPMLALELNAGAAPEMFQTWDEFTKEKLRIALWWDYLFIFIYPAAIAAACFIAARFLANTGTVAFKYSLIIICLQLVAAIFDASENFALLKVLGGSPESLWPGIARWCAILKFGLVMLGMGYAVIIGGGFWLITLIRHKQ